MNVVIEVRVYIWDIYSRRHGPDNVLRSPSYKCNVRHTYRRGPQHFTYCTTCHKPLRPVVLTKSHCFLVTFFNQLMFLTTRCGHYKVQNRFSFSDDVNVEQFELIIRLDRNYSTPLRSLPVSIFFYLKIDLEKSWKVWKSTIYGVLLIERIL